MSFNFPNGALAQLPSVSANSQAQPQKAALTPTAMGRWSVLTKQLPAVKNIRHLHIYDFDNTLFKTPLPNTKLWNGPTIGTLSNPDCFANGGWWHDSRILAATGDGLEKEEQRSWEGWWNEKIVELVRLSSLQKDALCVLLTGRSEKGFGQLVKRMAASKDLDFDMVSLKPAVGPNNERFTSTMNFKQIFLRTLMETYKEAEEIRIYEDRPKHVKGFRDFLTQYNQKQNDIGGTPTRGPIVAEVIQVADISTNLDPMVEVAEIQHLINDHNEAVTNRVPGVRAEKLVIKKTVFFTGYLIAPDDTKRLLGLAQLPPNLPESEMKFHANNVLICSRPVPDSILAKVGGMGNKMTWQVTGTACYENKIWAARLAPVPHDAKFFTDNPQPLVVLALRKGARPVDAGKIQNWQPVTAANAYTFETTVGEKVLMRIEAEDPSEGAYESLFPNKTSKRKHNADEESRGGSYHQRRNDHHHANNRGRSGQNQGRSGHRGGGMSKGYRGGPRGGGNARGGRGRGGGHHYRSLDDLGGGPSTVTYDDNPQPGAAGGGGGGGGGGGYGQRSQQQPYYNQSRGGGQNPSRGGGGGRPSGGQGYGTGGPELQNFY